MAKMFDKVLDFLGVENTEEQDDYDEYQEPERDPIQTVRKRSAEDAYYDQPAQQPQQSQSFERKRKSNLVSVPGGQTRQNMVLYQPQSNEDTQNIIDFMKTHRSVIINLEVLEKDIAQRILDYVSGASYALNGKIHKISSEIFLLAPFDANVMNNLPNTGRENISRDRERERDRDFDRYDRRF